ncbi:MAG: hypothetical protein AB7V56_11625 [Candidatus Nitrosocosmicus sp.]
MLKSNRILPKLKISQPNDPSEREADRVAEQVMRMSASSNNLYNKGNNLDENSGSTMQINRKCTACEEEEPKKIKKNFKSQSVIVVV